MRNANALAVFATLALLLAATSAVKLDAATLAARQQKVEQELQRTNFGRNGELRPLINRIRGRYRRCIPSVCFMLTGSQALSASAEKVQRDFVFTAAGLLAIANPVISLSAVQYAQRANALSKPTKNPQVFQQRVLRPREFGKTPRVRLAPAMLMCLSHFARQNRAPRKIVILADSAAPRVRESGPLRPTRIARFFTRAVGSDVCAVTVGPGGRGRRRLEKIVGFDDSKILQADAWGVLQLRELLEPLVDSICSAKEDTSPEWNQFDE